MIILIKWKLNRVSRRHLTANCFIAATRGISSIPASYRTYVQLSPTRAALAKETFIVLISH